LTTKPTESASKVPKLQQTTKDSNVSIAKLSKPINKSDTQAMNDTVLNQVNELEAIGSRHLAWLQAATRVHQQASHREVQSSVASDISGAGPLGNR
jgi:paraquat-inducible protein B